MTERTRSATIIVATLVLGIVIGALGASAIISSRVDQFRRLRAPGGPRGMVEEVIRPTDEGQRARVAAALDSMAARLDRLRTTTMEQHTTVMDALRAELQPILTAEQLQRFDNWREHDRGRGGPFGGPHGHPPHDRRGDGPPRP